MAEGMRNERSKEYTSTMLKPVYSYRPAPSLLPDGDRPDMCVNACRRTTNATLSMPLKMPIVAVALETGGCYSP